MRRLLMSLAMPLVLGCGQTRTTNSPYLFSSAVVAPIDPFVVKLSWEPPAGDVEKYTVEARPSCGTFTDVPFLPHASALSLTNIVDLKQVAPNGEPVELRIRADPGGFESNILRYDPGPALSTVSVTMSPDPSAHAFLVHFGNRTAPQVLLQRRVIDGAGASGPFVQVAAGSGFDLTYSDTDLAAWTDGAAYEYQAVSAAAGALASRSATTSVSLLLAPEIVSFRPGAGTSAVVTVRNNSSHTARLSLAWARYASDPYPTFLDQADAPPGGAIAFTDIGQIPFIHFQIAAQTKVASSGPIDAWEALQSVDALLQPTTTTLQLGSSAARDAAGHFCIVEFLYDRADSFGSVVGSAVFAPAREVNPLVLPTMERVKCRIDASRVSHVVWVQPAPRGAQGNVMHSWHDGTSWQTELIAPTVDRSPAFDIGADGTLYAAWHVDEKNIELGTLIPGKNWTLEPIPGPAINGLLAVSGDELGAPHLLSLSFSQNYHLSKDASGWRADQMTRFYISDCTYVEMSVVGGVVSFISDEFDSDRRYSYVRGNSQGWTVAALGLTRLRSVAHSADGRDFIAVGDAVAIVRNGAITSATVPTTDASSAGFSANGKAWVLEWTAPRAYPTAAAPAISVPTFLFDER